MPILKSNKNNKLKLKNKSKCYNYKIKLPNCGLPCAKFLYFRNFITFWSIEIANLL